MILKDKVALITGAAQGIGKAIATRFAEEGAFVIVCDINAKAKDVVRDINEKGLKAVSCITDIADYNAVQEAVENLSAKLGKIDIVVNNAGITRDSMFHKMTLENWKKVLDVNINGTFNCLRAVVPGMRERKSGNIVNISSTSRFGNIGQSNYSTSKAGIAGLTRVLAKELGGKGIRVNAVAPGAIETSMYDKVPEEIKKITRDKTALKRMGRTDEIASLCLFLASDESSYITGQIIHCDGGLYTF